MVHESTSVLSLPPSDFAEAFAGMLEDRVSIVRPEVNRLTVSQWATTKRVLPQGLTSMPGPFSWEVTPYLREIADCLSESSPVQKVVLMKGSRIGATVGVGENWIGYILDICPAPPCTSGRTRRARRQAWSSASTR